MIDDFFSSSSRWLTEIAFHNPLILGSRYGQKYLFPTDGMFQGVRDFPEELGSWKKTKKVYPDIRFLPYVGRSLQYFIASIPDYLQEGQDYNRIRIKEAIDNFFVGSAMTITEHVKSITKRQDFDDLQSALKAVRDFPEGDEIIATYKYLGEIATGLEALYELYRLDPGLLNKRLPDRDPDGRVNSERTLRQEILDAGGKGSRKPLHFRLKHGARPGRFHAES